MKGKNRVMDIEEEIDLEFEHMMAGKIDRGPKTDWSAEELEKERIIYRREMELDKKEFEGYVKFMNACRARAGKKRRKLQEVLSLPREVLEAKRQSQVVQEQANQYAMMALPGIEFVHINLRAKAKSAVSTDEPPREKLFFAELAFADGEKEPEIFAMFELPDSSSAGEEQGKEGHGDSDVAIVRGCRFCPRGATSPIFHPVGQFCAGIPYNLIRR